VTTNPQTDEVRAAALLVAEARAAVHESLGFLAAPEADRVRALVADLETAIEGRTAICLSAVSVPAPAPTDEVAEVAKHVTRAIFALKTPSPDGSKHYQSGWDDGLEAAMDAARDAVLAVLPAPADRAAIRAEAAELVRAMADEHPSNAAWVQDCQHIADRIAAAASGSGRVADETQAPAAVTLSAAERQFLTFALDLASDRMASCGDEFDNDADEAALKTLRRLADGKRQPDAEAPWATDGARIGRTLIWSWVDIGKGEFARGYRAAQEQARAFLTRPLLGAPEAQQSAVVSQPDGEARTVCVCGHTRGEHLTVSGRLLCDACDPDSTDNRTCDGFEAL
jgi:hypothetical protein